MKRVLVWSGVLALALAGCGKEPEQQAAQPAPAPATQALPADHPPAEVTVEPAEVLAELPSGHPVLEGLTDQASAPVAGHDTRPRNEPQVVVPDSVAARWKAVTLEVTVAGAAPRELRVEPGSQVALEQDGLSLAIGAFLPAYMSDFNQVTSEGDELSNPALQVSVLQNGEKMDSGWVFRDYPDFNTLGSERVKVKLLSAHE